MANTFSSEILMAKVSVRLRREAIYWFALSALCLLFILSLAILMFTVFTNTTQEKGNTGTDEKPLDGDDGSSGPSPPMHVIVQVGSGRKATNGRRNIIKLGLIHFKDDCES
ncbi:hypothetical protein MTO96_032959 [Rhipicephalus appendiculatus]